MVLREKLLEKLKLIKSNDAISLNESYVPVIVTQNDFDKIESELSVKLTSDYKWFLSTINGLDIDGLVLNGVVVYDFEPDTKRYDVISETALLRKQLNEQHVTIDFSNLLSLNSEDSDYLVLYDTHTDKVGVFSSVPNFHQIENSTGFLEYVISVLDEYLNE